MRAHTADELEVRKAISGYLAGLLTVGQLHNALAPIAYGDDPPEVASDVALTIAEYRHGDYPEDEVHARLHALVESLPAILYEYSLTYPKGRGHLSRHVTDAGTQLVVERALAARP